MNPIPSIMKRLCSTYKAETGLPVESRLLLLLTRPDLSPEDVRAATRLMDRGIDWEKLGKLAAVHRVLPVVFQVLSRRFSGQVPAPVLADFRRRYLIVSGRNWRLFRLLVDLTSRFERAGIRAVCFKGPVLSAAAYGRLNLRTFVDLDIVTDPADLPRLEQLVTGMGFTVDVPVSRIDRQKEHHLVFRRAPDLLVEVHWGFTLPDDIPFAVPFGRLWRRRGVVRVEGVPLASLSEVDRLMILSVHGFKHSWDTLGWVLDIAMLIRRRPVDWRGLFTEADRRRCRRMVNLALLTAESLYGPVLPEAVRANVWGDSTARFIARRWSRRIFEAADTADEVRERFFQRTFFHLLAMPRLSDRLRCLWVRHLQPTEKEYALADLPPALSFLYIPMRPARLAGEGLARVLSRL